MKNNKSHDIKSKTACALRLPVRGVRKKTHVSDISPRNRTGLPQMSQGDAAEKPAKPIRTDAPKRVKTSPTMYVGKVGTYQLIEHNKDTQAVGFTRVWAMPNHETFKIRPIATLLERYVGEGWNWIDPFAGDNSPAKMTNDHNPKTKAIYHMEALEFAQRARHEWGFEGVLFDPPYSFRQISEHYKFLGMKAQQWQTSMAFYEKVKSALADKIKPGGWAISFGWNSNGFGKGRGFRIHEILLVSHGGTKNDTIVTVERKIT